MRKLLPLLAAVFMMVALGQSVQAKTVDPSGWRVVDGQVVWT